MRRNVVVQLSRQGYEDAEEKTMGAGGGTMGAGGRRVERRRTKTNEKVLKVLVQANDSRQRQRDGDGDGGKERIEMSSGSVSK